MQPNFPDGEYLLTEKVSYYRSNPQRGDVVVFTPPISADDYIKRVIGLPGETISVRSGKIYINNQILKEDYLQEDVFTEGGGFLRDGDCFYWYEPARVQRPLGI